MSWMKTNRQRLEADMQGKARRKYLSPVYLGQYNITIPRVLQNSFGRFIDLGCGAMPYRSMIENLVEVYDSLDFFPRSADITYTANIQDMPEVKNNFYDSAMCLEVLEHVSCPLQALQETNRILKPGGILVLSVPHLSRLHDVPHDYYRYTKFGLEYLLKESGFTILSIEERGGLFTFLGHQISLFLLCGIWGIPIIRSITFWLNSFLVTRFCYLIDQMLNLGQIFPCGYTVVAKK